MVGETERLARVWEPRALIDAGDDTPDARRCRRGAAGGRRGRARAKSRRHRGARHPARGARRSGCRARGTAARVAAPALSRTRGVDTPGRTRSARSGLLGESRSAAATTRRRSDLLSSLMQVARYADGLRARRRLPAQRSCPACLTPAGHEI